ncbi:Aldo-ket-red domain-containing protein [Mycena chlorophos]|uniref:Aldo-ket-red domain-containing protein n=1 Tax=Mycena chlorophos TaxID=658473 RepID=A0A8H6S1E8_MYCCL|nr:Aldo-ket-red domain-containing protein [Mycena chlorophos]
MRLVLRLALSAVLLTTLSSAQVVPPNLPPGPMILLNSAQYPTVTDHHCLAVSCSFINTNGMIRDNSTTSRTSASRRRRAIGCDGVTNCHTSLTGTSCDEIFYASTYSGGLGCYAANYIANGGVLGNLPPLGTHRCVAAADNSAHGGAVNRWYVNNRIPDGGVFYFSFLIPANGCMNAASSYCRRMFNVANGYVGDSYGQICSDGLADGRQFAGITTSQRTQHPRCPSRGYGPANITGTDDDSQSDDSEDDEDLVGDMSLVPGPAPSLTDHVYKLSSQRFIWSPFRSNVTLAVGDMIMVPVNDTSTDSDVEEEETVVAAGRFQDVVGTDSLPDCPT